MGKAKVSQHLCPSTINKTNHLLNVMLRCLAFEHLSLQQPCVVFSPVRTVKVSLQDGDIKDTQAQEFFSFSFGERKC